MIMRLRKANHGHVMGVRIDEEGGDSPVHLKYD